MSSRNSLKHVVSLTQPSNPSIGDEWYNTANNTLYKFVAVNGTSPTWSLVGSGSSSAVSGATITDDTSTNATRYLMLGSTTSGAYTTAITSSSKLTFNPNTGVLFANTINVSTITTTANGSNGTAGQILTSNGANGVYWANASTGMTSTQAMTYLFVLGL
jgi:hypothetical protein